MRRLTPSSGEVNGTARAYRSGAASRVCDVAKRSDVSDRGHRRIGRRHDGLADLLRERADRHGNGVRRHRPSGPGADQPHGQRAAAHDRHAGPSGDEHRPDRKEPYLRDRARHAARNGGRLPALQPARDVGRRRADDRPLFPDAGRRARFARDRHRDVRDGLRRRGGAAPHQGGRRHHARADARRCRARRDAEAGDCGRRRRYRAARRRNAATAARSLGQRAAHRTTRARTRARPPESRPAGRQRPRARAVGHPDAFARAHRARLPALQARDRAAPDRTAHAGERAARPARVPRFPARDARRGERAARRHADRRHAVLPRSRRVRLPRTRGDRVDVLAGCRRGTGARLGRRLRDGRGSVFDLAAARPRARDGRVEPGDPGVRDRHRRSGDRARARAPIRCRSRPTCPNRCCSGISRATARIS